MPDFFITGHCLSGAVPIGGLYDGPEATNDNQEH
jgi:hypothetical protein